MPVLQGRGSRLILQMRHEHLGWRLVAEALAGLVVEMACELGQVVL